MSNPVLRSTLLGVVALASGCASTYTPDALRGMSPGQYGTLEQVDARHGGVLVNRVDDHWAGIRPPRTYALAPGEHSVTASANLPFYTSTPLVLWFDVAPGGHYLLQPFTAKRSGQWGFEIVDASSGVRVDRLWSNAPGDRSTRSRGLANPAP